MRQARVLAQGRHDVLLCVEINQCVGCTRQFFTKSFPGDDAAILARSSGEELASPRHRAGVASMTRRPRTRRKFDFHTGSTTRRWAYGWWVPCSASRGASAPRARCGACGRRAAPARSRPRSSFASPRRGPCSVPHKCSVVSSLLIQMSVTRYKRCRRANSRSGP